MPFMDVLRRKRQRTEGPEGPEGSALAVSWPAEEIEVVDVDEEPIPTSPSQVPPMGAELSSPPRTAVNPKGGGQGKDSLGPSVIPLVIFPEVPEGVIDEENQELVRHYEARLREGGKTRQIIGEYLAEVPPAEIKGKASRADLEPFFRGRVGERYVPLLAELAQGMIRGMLDIPACNLARNGTDNEVSLSSAARLSSLRVSSYFIWFIIVLACLSSISSASSSFL